MGRESETFSTLRATSPALPTPQSEDRTKRRTSHVECQAYSPRRNCRHWRHRRELGGPLPGERFGGRGDRYRAERRSRLEALRRSSLARAQEIGPRAWRVTIEIDVHCRPFSGG